MNVKVEELSSVKKKVCIEVAVDKVDQAIGKAFVKIGKNAKLKGFRKGKVPLPVLEKYYASQMEQEVFSRLIGDTYFKALTEHEIAAVGEPSIVDTSGVVKGQPFTYAAEVEVKPKLEIKDYQGLALEKEKLAISAKLVDERLQELQASRARLEVSKRQKARVGDSVEIDFDGSVEGVPFDGGKGEDFLLELGSETFIPGFEEQLVGMQRDREKEVNVTFPEAYGQKELAGKAAIFKVRMKEIKEKVAPDLDDDFAKEFGMKDLAELREQLAESHQTQEHNRIENELREQLVEALVDRNPIEVPEAMVSKQLEYMYANIVNRMRSQGLTPEILGMTSESFREQYRDTAVRQVQGSLILEAIGTQEQITVADDEIDVKLEEIAKMANAPLDAVKKHYADAENRTGLLAQIAEENVIRFLLDKAKIKQVSTEKLAKRKAAKEAS